MCSGNLIQDASGTVDVGYAAIARPSPHWRPRLPPDRLRLLIPPSGENTIHVCPLGQWTPAPRR